MAERHWSGIVVCLVGIMVISVGGVRGLGEGAWCGERY